MVKWIVVVGLVILGFDESQGKDGCSYIPV